MVRWPVSKPTRWAAILVGSVTACVAPVPRGATADSPAAGKAEFVHPVAAFDRRPAGSGPILELGVVERDLHWEDLSGVDAWSQVLDRCAQYEDEELCPIPFEVLARATLTDGATVLGPTEVARCLADPSANEALCSPILPAGPLVEVALPVLYLPYALLGGWAMAGAIRAAPLGSRALVQRVRLVTATLRLAIGSDESEGAGLRTRVAPDSLPFTPNEGLALAHLAVTEPDAPAAALLGQAALAFEAPQTGDDQRRFVGDYTEVMEYAEQADSDQSCAYHIRQLQTSILPAQHQAYRIDPTVVHVADYLTQLRSGNSGRPHVANLAAEWRGALVAVCADAPGSFTPYQWTPETYQKTDGKALVTIVVSFGNAGVDVHVRPTALGQWMDWDEAGLGPPPASALVAFAPKNDLRELELHDPEAQGVLGEVEMLP